MGMASSSFMNFLPFVMRPLCLLSARSLSVVALLVGGLSSVEAELPAPPPSPHFASVTRHVPPQGIWFSYVDLDGDMTRLSEGAQEFYHKISGKKAELELKPLAAILGLHGIKAVAASSQVVAPLFHNRALIYTPEGPQGLLRMFGHKPAPCHTAVLAPLETDFAFQWQLSTAGLRQVSLDVVKSARPDKVAQVERVMDFPTPGLKLNVGQLLDKLELRLHGMLRVDKEAVITPPGMAQTVPLCHAAIVLEGAHIFVDPLTTLASAYDFVTMEKGQGFTILRLNEKLPAFLEKHWQPLLYHDHASQLVVVGTQLAYIKEILSTEPKLSANPAWTQATAHLPQEVNAMWFFSNRAHHAVDKWNNAWAEGTKAESPLMDAFFEVLARFYPVPEKVATAGVYACLPDGLLFASNDLISFKSMFTILPSFGLGLGEGYQRAMQGRAAQRPPAEPPADDENEAPQLSPARQIAANLYTITHRAELYFLDHVDEASVSYQRLVSEDLLEDLEVVAGESYDALTLDRKGGTLRVTTKQGKVIERSYPAVTD